MIAAVIGMIPQGPFTHQLGSCYCELDGQKIILVQQQYCIETLARVDTLCLDKTGTYHHGKHGSCSSCFDVCLLLRLRSLQAVNTVGAKQR